MPQGFINVYRSGFFHRKNKPLTCDRHGGDIYLSEEAAGKDIDPKEWFVATVPIFWSDPQEVECNPPESIPIPLSQTRKNPHA